MSITCTSCGTALPEGAMFCGECGRATRARNVPSKRQPAMAPPVVDPSRDTIAMDRDMLAASLNDPTLFSGPAVIPKAPAAAATPAPTSSSSPAPTSASVGGANAAGNNVVPASADQPSADQPSADQPSAEPAGTDVADAESLDDGVADETDSPVDPSEQSV
ncbi:MAG: hypothetical protein JWQ43_3950, partial [Glaciihabitans sp.]|nr:hypothetical protein [Glaciihabitans sp.]